MGDILGGVFGGGKQTAETQTADPVSQASNALRYQQLANLFQNQAYSDYGASRPDVFSLSPQTQGLIDQYTSSDNLMSLNDYMDLGLDTSQNYIKQIAEPEIASNMALQGMSNSGASNEAIAKATAQIGLPFVQSLPQFGVAQSQSMGNMVNLSNMAQQLKQQDLLRTQGVVTTGLTGLPYTPTLSKAGEEGSMPLFNMFGMGNSF